MTFLGPRLVLQCFSEHCLGAHQLQGRMLSERCFHPPKKQIVCFDTRGALVSRLQGPGSRNKKAPGLLRLFRYGSGGCLCNSLHFLLIKYGYFDSTFLRIFIRKTINYEIMTQDARKCPSHKCDLEICQNNNQFRDKGQT